MIVKNDKYKDSDNQIEDIHQTIKNCIGPQDEIIEENK